MGSFVSSVLGAMLWWLFLGALIAFAGMAAWDMWRALRRDQ